MSSRPVDYQFKILYALGIIFIVAGHTYGGGISLLYDWIAPYAFHLSLFMFDSGYFYNENNERNISDFLRKKTIRLIVPLYLWNIVYGLFVQLTRLGGFKIGQGLTLSNLLIAPITSGHQFAYNMCCWFLIPLFMIHVYNVFLRKAIKKIFGGGTDEWGLFLFNFILGLIGVNLAIHGYNSGWYLVLVRFLVFIPFYELGILYRKKLEAKDHINSLLYFAIIGILCLCIIYVYKKVPTYTFSWCRDLGKSNMFMPFISGTLGIAIWLRISRIFLPSLGKSRLINLIADNTWSIMVHQFIGFMLVKLAFCMVHLYTPFCHTFNMAKFKSEIFYYYLPNGRPQMLIIYLVAGLVVPLGIHWVIRRLQNHLCKYKWMKWGSEL